ncbi:MAG: hypothetical protein ACI9JD_000105 [Rhodococcus sp. (in: high G+C Gram-positive bacteria)]|jgi:hypothetical protein
MGASSLMGSCSSLAVRRPLGEVMGSSCTCVDHAGRTKGATACAAVTGGALEPRRKAAHHSV